MTKAEERFSGVMEALMEERRSPERMLQHAAIALHKHAADSGEMQLAIVYSDGNLAGFVAFDASKKDLRTEDFSVEDFIDRYMRPATASMLDGLK